MIWAMEPTNEDLAKAVIERASALVNAYDATARFMTHSVVHQEMAATMREIVTESLKHYHPNNPVLY